MSDKILSDLPPNIAEYKTEAVGIRIMGKVDPRTITREVFEESTELLLHGSSKPVNFSSKFDYSSTDYLIENDGSATLGFGFYTIDKKEEAENYSKIRKADISTETVVIHVLPYQARMLDLRKKANLTENAPVSHEFMLK